MAILVRNTSTNEVTKVNNVRFKGGEIVAEWQCNEPGTRFYAHYPFIIKTERTQYHEEREKYCRVFKLAEGFELVAKTPRTNTKKQEETKQETRKEENVKREEIKQETKETETPKDNTQKVQDEDARQLAAILSRMKGGNIDADKVREIVREELQTVKPRTIQVVTATSVNKVNGATCKNYSRLCNIVNKGKPVYMYGPAGCGKSYTARQIADGLGLDYYETSQAMFAHELKGYGDAKGEFVPTSFSKAYINGGLFFLDEVDASAPEALVVLNNAIANGTFDFPVIGNVKAHDKFRVIAAGNTKMTGATLEYTARQMQDTSFKNRFFFDLFGYDDNIMLQIAGGDTEITSFGDDLRRAARQTGISQLFSYRQCEDLATLQECCEGDDVYLLRGSVLQEKTVDDTINLYEHLSNKENRWAKAMKKAIEQMKNEEVW